MKSQETEILKVSKELFCSERLPPIDIQYQGCSLKRGIFPVVKCGGPLNILLGLCPAVCEGEFFGVFLVWFWMREKKKKGKGIVITCKCSFKSHAKCQPLEAIFVESSVC